MKVAHNNREFENRRARENRGLFRLAVSSSRPSALCTRVACQGGLRACESRARWDQQIRVCGSASGSETVHSICRGSVFLPKYPLGDQCFIVSYHFPPQVGVLTSSRGPTETPSARA